MSRGTLAYIQLQAADLLMSATRAYKHEQIPRSHGKLDGPSCRDLQPAFLLPTTRGEPSVLLSV